MILEIGNRNPLVNCTVARLIEGDKEKGKQEEANRETVLCGKPMVETGVRCTEGCGVILEWKMKHKDMPVVGTENTKSV